MAARVMERAAPYSRIAGREPSKCHRKSVVLRQAVHRTAQAFALEMNRHNAQHNMQHEFLIRMPRVGALS